MEDNTPRKRNVAYKMMIGDIIKGQPIQDQDKLIGLQIADKQVSRVNIIANCVDKYTSDAEKKYASITIDDASGQLRLKLFADDFDKAQEVLQGDTLQVVGTIRSWNDELYLTPEVIKRVDPRWLLVRKLEIQQDRKTLPQTEKTDIGTRDQVLNAIKTADKDGGIDAEKLVMDIKANPDQINKEVKTLLEEGLIYEPRPGRLRYLG